MRLLVASHKECWRDPGGAGAWASDGGFPFQMAALAELFDDTVLLLPRRRSPAAGGTPLAGPRLGVEALTPLPGRGLWRKLLLPLWLLRNLPRVAPRLRAADCVHVPLPSDVGTLVMLAALATGKRLFVRHCGSWTRRATLAERLWRAFMERFASAERPMWATGDPAQAPPAANEHIRWIFATSLWQRDLEALAAPRRLEPTGPVLACVGRLEPGKGVELAIGAAALLGREHPGLRLEIVGRGSLQPALSAAATAAGVAERTLFHGLRDREGVVSVLRRATLFLFPSTASEGFPKAPLEALAAGVPVVATPQAYLARLEHRGCGILIEPPTAEHLAAGVRRALGDPEAYAVMSRRAIDFAREFTLEQWQLQIRQRLQSAWGPLAQTTPPADR